jgi:D-arginine dehydrogenase
MGVQQADFVVVGAGVAGLSVAAALAPHGRVLVLEQEAHPGVHATGRSAAIFSRPYGVPAVQALSAVARRHFERAGETGEPLLASRGILHLVTSVELGEAHTRASDLAHCEPVTAAQALELAPHLAPAVVEGGYYEADAADIDVHGLTSGYLRQLKAHGGELRLATPAVAISREGGTWRVETAAGAISTPVLVNAAGAWAGEIGRRAGTGDLGLTPLRRSAAIVDAPGGVDPSHWPMVVDADERVYFKPEAGKLMLSPCDEAPSEPCDVYADDYEVAVAVHAFEQLTGSSVRRVHHTWAGLRTFVPDRVPAVGFDRNGLFWMAGQGGSGVQIAPGAAALAADLILGRAVDPLVAPHLGALSPNRFAG